MKINDLKSLLEKEIDEIEPAPMSKKLAYTKIQRKSTFFEAPEPEVQPAKKHSYSKFKIALASFSFVLAICLSLVFLIPSSKSNYSNLTSYIIDLDPTICLTANASNEVVSVFSLNEDGDDLLEDIDESELTNQSLDTCVQKIVTAAIDKGFIDRFHPSPIDISVTNNENSYSEQKCEYIKNIFKEKLEAKGMSDFEIKPMPMDLENFKNRIGMENDFSDLDKMEFDIKNRRRFFDPNRLPSFFQMY